MSDLTVNEKTTIVIKKNKGITHALRDYVKSNPNSVITDGKITPKEWNAALDALVEINNNRKSANKTPIFTGGTDKTRAGWHTSFVVHPEQKIEFTSEEMDSIYKALGVTFKKEVQSQEADPAKSAPSAAKDSAPTAPQDTTKVAPPVAKDSIPTAPQDTTKVVTQPPAAEEVSSVADSTDVEEASVDTSSKKSRYELSWGEIGKISLKSAKNFVKGMFCDEDGFSLKRTATTVGVVAGLALAAPAAAAAGASAAVVGGVALAAKTAGLGFAGVMAYNGGKNAIEGGQKYYNSTTEEEAKANMEQAMDGAVEAAAALPAFFAIKGGANKGNKIAKNKASQKPAVEEAPKAGPEAKPTESNSTPEVKPLEDPIQLTEEPRVRSSEFEIDFSVPEANQGLQIAPNLRLIEEPKVPQGSQAAATPKSEPKISEPASKVEPKPAEEVKLTEATKSEAKPNEAKPVEPEIIRTENSLRIQRHRNADGKISKDVVIDDSNGKYSYTKEYQYTSDGAEAGYIMNWASGTKDVFKTGTNEGVRTKTDGTQWIIKKEGTKIVEVEQIKPNAKTPAAEVKPIEDAAPKAEVKAEEAKVETKDVKPAENAGNDYNKAVSNEIVKQTDGTTKEYFYNEACNIVKAIYRDKNGKFDCECIYEYNSNGQQVKNTYRNSNNNIRETFYENGLETKNSWKWANGNVDELKPVGENLYEGVRTYPDGRKVKIKEENYRTIELGPVE